MSYLLNYNPGTPQYTYPRRGGARLSGTAIIHTAECAMDLDGSDSSAENCASFIANRADYGSYHRIVDSDSIIDMVPWEYEAWQDSETNNWAVGISAALSANRWLEVPPVRRDRFYRNMAACAADFVQYMASKGISVPLRRISGAEARARVPGFCAHGDSGISRSDPGVQFDWALFFRYTQEALANGGITVQGTTTQEDELSAAEATAIIEAVNFAFKRIKEEIPTDTAKAVLAQPVTYHDPLTGEATKQTTTLGTVVSFNDFNEVQTRLSKSSAQEIASVVPKEIAAEVVALLTKRLAA